MKDHRFQRIAGLLRIGRTASSAPPPRKLLVNGHAAPQPQIEAKPSEVEFFAFGAEVKLHVPANDFLIDDSRWRLKHIYEPYFSSRAFAKDATVIDVGAGFGSFAIPFALANKSSTVWCFEPDEACCNALAANVARYDLQNIRLVRAAIVSDDEWKRSGGSLEDVETWKAGRLDDLACKIRVGMQDSTKKFLQRLEPGRKPPSTVLVQALPARVCARLAPDIVKIIAPMWEAEIVDALREVAAAHILGESWGAVPTSSLYDCPAPKGDFYMPFAGRDARLSRSSSSVIRSRDGVDVVVAMYNDSRHILECVEGIVGNGCEAVRAIVVDDGSSDGCGELVKERYAGNPRVRVVRKPNGGCASARNFGRRHSNATHIAFVDSDDVPDKELFPTLLELSRTTGRELVQGGFDFLHVNTDGLRDYRPSYEHDQFCSFPNTSFFDIQYQEVPAHVIMLGQPTIWRRVYRRDFLDNKKIFFPEHIRAFDDQYFQLLCLQYVSHIPHIPSVKYHYRQHAGQDIKQGDDRHFYCLSMFRMLVKRGLKEGWLNMAPLLRAYVNTVNWSLGVMKPGLHDAYLKGAAELWVMMEKCLGTHAFSEFNGSEINNPSFYHFEQIYREKLRSIPPLHTWSYLDSVNLQPAYVRMAS